MACIFFIFSHAAAGRRWGTILLAAAMLFGGTRPAWAQRRAPGAAEELTPAAVENAIRRGIDFLKSRQLPSGGWSEYQNHPCGATGLVTLALLNSGVEVGDPSIQKALQYLRSKQTTQTYSIALQTMALCEAGQLRDRAQVRRNAQAIAAGISKDGGWHYSLGAVRSDPSNTQFALLALDAAERFGVEIPRDVWLQARQYWLRRQIRDARNFGGWAYDYSASATGSMTCAGIASLIITAGRAENAESSLVNSQITCCGTSNATDPVQAGLDWLARNFTVNKNPGDRSAALYYMYALERVGRLTGQRKIGEADWYREGAAVLVATQRPVTGNWVGTGLGENREWTHIATSFALLFLSKGKRQVVISRLQYLSPGDENAWTRHPGSMVQLVRYVEESWRRELAWQTVEMEAATLEDLMQTPVLHISGSEPLTLSDEQKQLLKEYVEQGGFIFAEATAGKNCGSGEGFRRSIEELSAELFQSPLKRLPPEHPIWYADGRIDVDAFSEEFWLYGVEACCRTSLVYSPISLTCRWELSDPAGREDYPENVEQELQAAVAVGKNVLAYATGRELKDKLEQRTVVRPEPVGPVPRGTLVIPRIEIGAGGDLAPRALPNLLEYMRQSVRARISSQPRAVPLETEALREYAVAFLHGRDSFNLSRAEKETLKGFLDGGGTLIVSSICGSDPFSDSVREEFTELYPGSSFAPLPASHPIYSTRYRGFDIDSVEIRRPGRSAGLNAISSRGLPVLEGLTVDGRIAVIFSPLDISCALENQSTLQCPGYDTETAAKIGINMILFAQLQ